MEGGGSHCLDPGAGGRARHDEAIRHAPSEEISNDRIGCLLAGRHATHRPGPGTLFQGGAKSASAVLEYDEVEQGDEEDESERRGEDELDGADPLIPYPPIS